MSEATSNTNSTPGADKEPVGAGMTGRTGVPPLSIYYTKAYQRIQATKAEAEADVEVNSDSRQSPADEPSSPTPPTENEVPPLYSPEAHVQRPSSQYSGAYRGYEHHFGPDGDDSRYASQNYPQDYGYGRPTYQPRHRQQYLAPASHMGYGQGDQYYGGRGHVHASSSGGFYDAEITPPRRRGQYQAQSSEGFVDAATYSPGAEIDGQYGEYPFGHAGEAQSRPSSTGNARLIKRKLAAQQASALSMDEDMEDADYGNANPDEDLFVAPQSAAESEASIPMTKASRAEKKKARRAKEAEDGPLFDVNGRVTKARGKGKGKGRGRPSAGAAPGVPEFETSRAKLLAALREKNPRGSGNIPSRNERQARWETHTEPILVDASTVSMARRIKNGIPADAKGKIGVKPTGANDPENISIVNMKDVDGRTFEEIATIVNLKRVQNGRMPNQKANTVNCRYNRTAPQMYALQGIEFVGIAERANAQGNHMYSKEQEELIWDDEMDDLLADIELEYRKNKWDIVAQKFAERTGHDWATATEVATRFSHI